MGKLRNSHVLVGILAVGALLRLCHFADLAKSPHFSAPLVDAGFHDYWARALVSGRWSPPPNCEDPQIRARPYLRPPGYPYFLALAYALSGGSYGAARVLQMAVGLLSCVLAFMLGLRLFGARTGLVYAALMASYWVLVYFEGELLAPVLLVFLGTALLLVLTVWAQTLKPLYAWGAGALLGLFALIRPNILLFGLVLPAWLWWVGRRSAGRRRILKSVAGFGFGVLVLVLPASLRNYRAAKDWVLISSNAGINLYIGNNPAADGLVAQELPGLGRFHTCYDYPALVRSVEQRVGQPLRHSQVSRWFARQALEFVRSNPGRFLALTGRKALLFWHPQEIAHNKEIGFERRRSRALRVLAVLPGGFARMLSLAVLGLGLCIGRPRSGGADGSAASRECVMPVVTLCLLFVAFYFLSFLPFFMAARYRVPILPCLLLFAAVALVRFAEALAARRLNRAAAGATVWLLLLFLFSRDPFGYRTSAAEAHFLEGVAYGKQGNVDAAIREYRAVLEEEPEHVRARANLAAALMSLGRYDEAVRHSAEALRVAPDDMNARCNLAVSLAEMGRTEEAIAQYNEFLRRAPEDLEMRSGLGVALARAGRLDEAVRVFSEVLRRHGPNPGAHANLGIAYARKKHYAAAVRHFSAALALNPGDRKLQAFLEQARAAAAGGDE